MVSSAGVRGLERSEFATEVTSRSSITYPEQSTPLPFVAELDSYVRLQGEAFAKIILGNCVGVEAADVLETMPLCRLSCQFECMGFLALIDIRKNGTVVD